MLGSLLPALWLLATGHCSADSITGCVGGPWVLSFSADRQGQPLPIPGNCSFDPSARCWNRRIWVYSGPEGAPPFLVASDLAPSRLSLADLPFDFGEGFPGLARCWQFYWRTASEPRAPSFIS